MNTVSRWVAVHEGALPKDFTGVVWREWRNCREADLEQLPTMALHRHLRDRGGVLPEENPLRVFVSIRKTENHPAVHYTEFTIRPNL